MELLPPTSLLSPDLQSRISAHEDCISRLAMRTRAVLSGFRAYQDAQRACRDAMNILATELELCIYDSPRLLSDPISDPTQAKPDPVLSYTDQPTAAKFNEMLAGACDTFQRMASVHESMSVELSDNVVWVLSKVLDEDFARVSQLQAVHMEAQRAQHASITRYAQLPAKKATEKKKYECNAEVYGARRTAHHAALEYCAELGVGPKRWQCVLLRTVSDSLSAMHRHMSLVHTDVQAQLQVQALNSDLFANDCRRECSSALQQIDQQRTLFTESAVQSYYPDPDPNDPLCFFLDVHPAAPRLDLKLIEGFLHVRDPRSKVRSRWEFVYCQVANNSLTMQLTPPVTLNLIGCQARPVAKDDRSHVIEVMTASRRSIYLQAENARSANEWTQAINLVARDFKALMTTPSNPNDVQKVLYFEQDRARASEDDGDASNEDGGDASDDVSHRGTDSFVWSSAVMQVTKDSSKQSHPVTVARAPLQPVRPPPPPPSEAPPPRLDQPRTNPFATTPPPAATPDVSICSVGDVDFVEDRQRKLIGMQYVSHTTGTLSHALSLSDISDGPSESDDDDDKK